MLNLANVGMLRTNVRSISSAWLERAPNISRQQKNSVLLVSARVSFIEKLDIKQKD